MMHVLLCLPCPQAQTPLLVENPQAHESQNVEESTADGEGGALVASDADVSVIAAHAAGLAFDTLSDREPSEFLSNVYFVGLRRGWIFDQPLHVLPLYMEPGESTSKAADPEAESRALEFLKEVISSDDDDSASTS